MRLSLGLPGFPPPQGRRPRGSARACVRRERHCRSEVRILSPAPCEHIKKLVEVSLQPKCFVVGWDWPEFSLQLSAQHHPSPAARLRAEIRFADRLRRSRASAFSYSRAVADRRFESSSYERKGTHLSARPQLSVWSAREDSNLRPHPPQGCALPGCATRRESFTLRAGARFIKVRNPEGCRAADEGVPMRL